MTFEELWEMQVKFQSNFFDPNALSQEDKIKWTKEFALCAHQELAEVMDSIKWKTYHMYDKQYDEKHVLEEVIDCFKFVMNIGIVWGMTAETFQLEFLKKTNETLNRLSTQK